MKVRPSAAIVKDGRLLTMRYRFGGQDVYALPGGNPDPAEGMTDTLVRELNEEIGVVVKPVVLLLSGEVLDWGGRKDTLHCVFSAEIISGIPVLNPAETTALEVVWLDISEWSEKILYPNIGAHLAEMMDGTGYGRYVGRIAQPMC